MQAKDIMRKRVITVTQDMSVRELAKLFIEKGITGAPVVDGSGSLLGVVSQTDLARQESSASPETEVPAYYHHGERPFHPVGFQIENPDVTSVKDIMTPAVLSAGEETPVEELAEAMLGRHIHRIVITRHGKLCGIVTSMDMLRALLAMSGKRGAATKR